MIAKILPQLILKKPINTVDENIINCKNNPKHTLLHTKSPPIKTVDCPSCQGAMTHKVGRIPDSDYFAGRTLNKSLPGGFLYQCKICDLMFRFPLLDKELTDQLYKEGQADNWQYNDRARFDWETAATWIDTRSKGDILDIGCFDGQFLSNLSSKFHYYGVEIHKCAAAIAKQRGVNIIGDNFSDIPDDAKYDAVTAFDVIEHVSDPLIFLKKMAILTKKSGSIVLSTGNTQARTWRIMGSRYWYCTIPEHISFISPYWCRKHAPSCGLILESMKVFSHSEQNSWITILKVRQTIVNLVYKFAPNMFSLMRKFGWGGKNVAEKAELINHPPPWLTAKDHFIVKFRKI